MDDRGASVREQKGPARRSARRTPGRARRSSRRAASSLTAAVPHLPNSGPRGSSPSTSPSAQNRRPLSSWTCSGRGTPACWCRCCGRTSTSTGQSTRTGSSCRPAPVACGSRRLPAGRGRGRGRGRRAGARAGRGRRRGQARSRRGLLRPRAGAGPGRPATDGPAVRRGALPGVPAEPHDQRVTGVVTPSGARHLVERGR
jgi:hypothetical protein